VRDTGCGIDEETVPHIFEPFFATKEPGVGTGLGLSTVYGIVKQAGGDIAVNSESGRGTEFLVCLPRTSEGKPEIQAVKPGEVTECGNEIVLVVEDEPEVRDLVRVVLQSSGYRVLEACEGDEALSLCERWAEPIQLLLTDVVMTRMNGPQLAERLRASFPEMKVLFMSGYPGEILARHGFSAEKAPLLQKPFTPAVLRRKVREVLETRDHRWRILVADDDPDVRGFLRELLERAGYEVADAANGKEVVQRVRNKQVHLVLMDLFMPEQEGLETIQLLARENADTKIVAMSGAFGAQFFEVARKLGARAALQKPLKGGEVLNTIRNVLARRQ
jgi:CheY-like chemotaxis protein